MPSLDAFEQSLEGGEGVSLEMPGRRVSQAEGTGRTEVVYFLISGSGER